MQIPPDKENVKNFVFFDEIYLLRFFLKSTNAKSQHDFYVMLAFVISHQLTSNP